MASTSQSGPPAVVLNGSFTGLPGELRQKIYRNLCLIEDEVLEIPAPIIIERARKPDVKTRFSDKVNPWKRRAHIVAASSHFLRCSKQIHAECTDVLYENKFTSKYATSFSEFEKTVGHLSFSTMHHLELSDYVFSQGKDADQFNSLLSLKTLTYSFSLRRVTAKSLVHPMPAPNRSATTDPLLLTADLRPRHLLNNRFVSKMASKHPKAAVTIEFSLHIGWPVQYWGGSYRVEHGQGGLTVHYLAGSAQFREGPR